MRQIDVAEMCAMTEIATDQTAALGRPWCCAAPAGGAQKWGRGCYLGLALSVMFQVAAPANAMEPADPVPSGLEVFVLEFLSDTDGERALLRARFTAPALTADAPPIEEVLGDMQHLCNTMAIPSARTMDPAPAQIIVSLSAEPIEFGTLDPEILQYFEAYSIQGDTCIWELY